MSQAPAIATTCRSTKRQVLHSSSAPISPPACGEGAARLQGLNPTVDYPAQGLHNWEQFGYQLNRSKPQVLNVMNAW